MIRVVLFLLLISFGNYPVLWGAPYDNQLAELHLEILLRNLTLIRDGVHYQDEARLFVMEKTVKATEASVRESGLISNHTNNLYYELCTRFRYSSVFFESVRMKRNERAIGQTLETVLAIRKAKGIDDEPPSILKGNAEQLVTSIDELLRFEEVSEPLRASLIQVRKDIRDLIAVTALGDGGSAFEKGRIIHESLKALYPELNGASLSSAKFTPSCMEIIGVNEIVGEYVEAFRR